MKPTPLLTLLLASVAVAEPGPAPREVRFDRDGNPLPAGAVARLGSARYREVHATRLAITPDGRRAVASDALSVRTWDLATGKLLSVTPLPPDFCGAVSADGTLAVHLRPDPPDGPEDLKGETAADVWDLRAGRCLHTLRAAEGHWLVVAAVAPDRSAVAVLERDHDEAVVRLWDVRTGRGRAVGRLPSHVYRLTFADRGRALIAWTRDDPGVVYGLDLARGRIAYKLAADVCPPTGDGRFFLAHAGPAGYRLFDAATGKAVRTRSLPDWLANAQVLALSADGTRVAASLLEDVIVWDLARGREACRYRADAVLAAFGPRNELVLTTWDGLHVLDAGTGRKLAGTDPDRALPGLPGSLGWPPDGRTLVASASAAWDRIWLDAATGRVLRRERDRQLPASGRVPGCMWPEGRWESDTWAPPDARGNRANSFGYGGETAPLVAVRQVEGVDRYECEPPYRFQIDEGTQVPNRETALMLRPRPGPKVVTVHERHTRQALWSVALDVAADLAFTHDGRRLATLERDRVRVWDAGTGRELLARQLPPASPPPANRPGGRGLCFSPDGRRLAVGNWDGTILVWDVTVPGPAPRPFAPEELARLWDELASADAKSAWRAAARLLDRPAEAATFVADRVRPLRPPAAEVAKQLLGELDSPSYPVREAAMKKVLALGDVGRLFAIDARKGAAGAAVRQRLDDLEARLAARTQLTADELRSLRALSVLEAAATPAAREAVAALAAGPDWARVPAAAKDALGRMPAPR